MVLKQLSLLVIASFGLVAQASADTLVLTVNSSGAQKVNQIDATGHLVASAAVPHKRSGESFAVGKLAGSTGYDVATITNNATTGKGNVNINRYGPLNNYISTVALGHTPVGYSRIIGLGDFDGDSKLEVVVLNPTHGSRGLYLLELQTDNTVVTTTIHLDPAVSFGTYEPGLGVSDMEADGDTDLVVQDPTTRLIKFLPFAGVTPSASLSTATLDPATFGQTSTFVADSVIDLNASGVGDLLFRPDSAVQSGKTLWFLNLNLQKSGGAVKYLTGATQVLAVGKGTVPVVVDIKIAMSAYSPQTANVPKGCTVRWTNTDFMGHTVTTDVTGSGPNSDTQFPSGIGNNQQYTFQVPANAVSGTKFFYHCRFHGIKGNGTSLGSGMVGVVVVN